MQRSTLLWTLVLFFGASLAFRTVQDVTAGEPLVVTILAQVALLVLIVAAIVVLVRRNERDPG